MTVVIAERVMRNKYQFGLSGVHDSSSGKTTSGSGSGAFSIGCGGGGRGRMGSGLGTGRTMLSNFSESRLVQSNRSNAKQYNMAVPSIRRKIRDMILLQV